MKVLLVNKYWYHRGGTERVLFLTKQLLEQQGHKVELFGMHHPANEINNKYFIDYVDFDEPQFLQKARAALATIYNKEAKRRFAQLIDDINPDVVHVHNIYHQLSFSLLEVTREKNIPVVMTLHDYKMLSPNYTLFHHGAIDDQSLGKKYYRCLLNNCMESFPLSVLATAEAYYREHKKYRQQIEHYIAPSQFMKDLCVQAGWNAADISVIHNPIEQEDTNIPRAKKGTAYVAYIGRLTKEKGVDLLLQAAVQTPEIEYNIIGSGKEKESLLQLAKELQLDNVHFLGWKSGKELQALRNNARLVVVPSRWYENCPYSILEAMQAGTLVVGANIGGIPELLPNQLLFEPNNANSLAKTLKTCYDLSSTEQKKIIKSLQHKVQDSYNPNGYIQELMAIYTRLSAR